MRSGLDPLGCAHAQAAFPVILPGATGSRASAVSEPVIPSLLFRACYSEPGRCESAGCASLVGDSDASNSASGCLGRQVAEHIVEDCEHHQAQQQQDTEHRQAYLEGLADRFATHRFRSQEHQVSAVQGWDRQQIQDG
jgi:hypothetical protein